MLVSCAAVVSDELRDVRASVAVVVVEVSLSLDDAVLSRLVVSCDALGFVSGVGLEYAPESRSRERRPMDVSLSGTSTAVSGMDDSMSARSRSISERAAAFIDMPSVDAKLERVSPMSGIQ